MYIYNIEYSILRTMENSDLKMHQGQRCNQSTLQNGQSTAKQQSYAHKQRKNSGCLLREHNTAFILKYQSEIQQKQTQTVKDIFFWKMLMVGLTLAEFSIQITVIVLQYISSKISLLPFIAFTSITLLLAAFAFISLNILPTHKLSQFLKSQRVNQRLAPNDDGQIPTPTLQKIKSNDQKRVCQKTLKLRSAISANQEGQKNASTFKQLNNPQKTLQNLNCLFLSDLTVNTNLYLIMLTKTLHILFEIIACTICFCTIENPTYHQFGLTALLLSLCYVLASFSSATLICLCMKICKNILRPISPLQNQQIIMSIKNQSRVIGSEVSSVKKHVGTALSIDKYIPSGVMDERKKQKKSMQTVQNIIINDQINIKNDNPNPSELIETVPTQTKSCKIGQPTTPIKDSASKITKKSLLKQSRKYLKKLQPIKIAENEGEINIQRKKVEINSKKIQYFEYTDMSSPKSDKPSDQENKLYTKATYKQSKIFNQQRRFFNRKLVNQQKLIPRKKQEHVKRAVKSAKVVCLGRETDGRLKAQPYNLDYYL